MRARVCACGCGSRLPRVPPSRGTVKYATRDCWRRARRQGARAYSTKPCRQCGTPYGPRRLAGGLWNWAAYDRSTLCSQECLARSRAIPAIFKMCGWCKKRFSVVSRSERAVRGGVQTCSPKCRAKFFLKARPYEEKQCAHCGEPFGPKNIGGAAHDWSTWDVSKMCSSACAGASRVTRGTLRCERCGGAYTRRASEIKLQRSRFCSKTCALGRIDLLGASLSVSDLARISGVTPGCVYTRMHKGLDPLTGKRKSK